MDIPIGVYIPPAVLEILTVLHVVFAFTLGWYAGTLVGSMILEVMGWNSSDAEKSRV